MTDGHHADRRSFLKTGAIAGTALAAGASGAIAQLADSSRPTKGDIAILRFLSAIEQIESDLWLQYAELGGVQDSEIPGLSTSTKGNKPYTDALNNLDADMSQYIHDNTEDEFSHHDFLNAYLQSIGATPVDLSIFATLKGSQATGANKTKLRLTNLMQLIVDTSWWTRYRSRDKNPDLDPSFVFPQAVPSLFIKGKPHPAIPPVDITDKDHIQAIANTAAFHFGFIEQGGTSLYPTLALRVTDPVVLRILLSIGPTETMHFQTWSDKAGNAVQPPFNVTFGDLTFPNLNAPPFPAPPPFGLEDFQTNLIMPEPCPFLNRKFPVVSVIRPVSISTAIFGAMAAVQGFTDDGLFIGQSGKFFRTLHDLAEDADEATRKCHRED
ncbi:MAG: twin-arginine translocation signal domain-containing protein [Pseudomonadota bacterium]|nr:twin-arginine translocation signal domain-containing protein [Pseudomonadota bacterium]